ncbi:hypothetical protein J6590_030080 [Homalodisca vitripennis]|nr:hypothetical protein J6590_030080 [Homalodisca vitripennis]
MMGYDMTSAEWRGVTRSIQMSGQQSSRITEYRFSIAQEDVQVHRAVTWMMGYDMTSAEW